MWEPHISLGQPMPYWPAAALGGSKPSPVVPVALRPLHLDASPSRSQGTAYPWEQNGPQQLQQCCQEPIPQQRSPQMPGTASACSCGLYESNTGLCSGYSFCSPYTKRELPFATPATEGRPARYRGVAAVCLGREVPAPPGMRQRGTARAAQQQKWPGPPLFTQDKSSSLPSVALHAQPDVMQQRMAPGVGL